MRLEVIRGVSDLSVLTGTPSKPFVSNLLDLLDYCIEETGHEARPRYVLELGGGIGTATQAIADYGGYGIDVYEHDPEFRDLLRKNVHTLGYLNIIDSYFTLPPKRRYDLVVIDGGKNEREGSFPQAVASILLSVSGYKAILIEGKRKSQRYWVEHLRLVKRPYKKLEHKGPEKGGVIYYVGERSTSNFIREFGAAIALAVLAAAAITIAYLGKLAMTLL